MISVRHTVYPYLIGVALLGVIFTTVIAVTRASLHVPPGTGIGSTVALHRAARQVEPARSAGGGAQDITPALRWRDAATVSSLGGAVAARSAGGGAQDITPALRWRDAATQLSPGATGAPSGTGASAPPAWRSRPI